MFYSISYNYDNSYWKDKLISFSGTSITYDQIGNPLNYRNGLTMTWQNGRELASITKSNTTYSFKYNLDGLRTEKSVGGSKTNYYYDSNNNLIGMKKGNDTVLFYHDAEGGLVSMSVGDNTYLFVKNLQGDVTKILDDSGDVLVNYTYDAWGKVLSTKNGNGQNITDQSSIAFLNPFRYRGYVYDTETQLYYLQSRYYDPITGRFINADGPAYTDTFSGSPLSTNMFAYCENDYISNTDYIGHDMYKNTYIKPTPQCPESVISAIERSGLNKKTDSVFDDFGRKRKGDGCHVYVFVKTLYGRALTYYESFYYESSYFTKTKTRFGWNNYIGRRLATLNEFKKHASELSDATGGVDIGPYTDWIAIAGVLLTLFASYIPPRERYILNQIKLFDMDKLKEENVSNKITIAIKVVNKKFKGTYNSKKGKYYYYLFGNKLTYYAYGAI